MREYKTSFDGHVVDLDDESIYDYLPKTLKELDNLMFCEIGKSLVYMDHLESRKGLFSKRKKKEKFVELSPEKMPGKMFEVGNSGYNQRQRIYKLINHFSNNRHKNYDNLNWIKEQIYLFQDEVENMC
jgi:hypothetical protein